MRVKPIYDPAKPGKIIGWQAHGCQIYIGRTYPTSKAAREFLEMLTGEMSAGR